MALESALWGRIERGLSGLRLLGHKVHGERIENGVGVGRPDVNICIDGHVFDAELKSHSRPKRPTTKIQFPLRADQGIWMHERIGAGCKAVWCLVQVGDGAEAALYLIPGSHYEDLIAPECDLDIMSVLENRFMPMTKVLLRAAQGW